VQGLQYLIQNRIIEIPPTQVNSTGSHSIPNWVKNNAKMWADGNLTEDDFLRGIQYLIKVGIISVNPPVVQNTTNPVVQNTTNPVVQNTTNPVVQNTTNHTTSSNNQDVYPSLLGSGINLKIINNTASGTLVFNGEKYNAQDVTMIAQGDVIKLTGYIQGTYNVLLNVVGTHTTGIEYQFNGMLINNDKSEVVKFTALLTNPAKPAVAIQKQNITSTATQHQTPGLPMLMMTSQNDRVYMAYAYNLVVKIFDPQSNPQKIFDQFIGGIPDVNITATVLDPNNKILGQSLGKTDSKGIYQDGINMPYTQYSQEQLQVIVNATKKGYVTQFATLPLLLIHPNSGSSSHFCSITTSSLPDGTFTGSAIAYSQTLSSNDCSSPTWTITSGSLPTGLSLSSAGVISGTPTATGTSTFVVKVTSGDGSSSTTSLSIKIN
jgi:hypothetical protein